MATAEVVLGLLATGHRHGYDLKHEHDLRFPQARPLAFGQVYATLARLARDGLIAPVETARAAGPDRTRYALTAAGRARLDAWLAEIEAPAPHVANPLFTKVVLAVLLSGSDATARDYLRDQRAAHLHRMREYTALKTDPGVALSAVLAADHALAHLDADLRWMELALTRIEHLRQEVLG